MKLRVLLLLLLLPSVALAQEKPYAPIKGSTKTLTCNTTSGSTQVALGTSGTQIYFVNRGVTPVFLNWGPSDVTAGTSNTVVAPGPAVFTRNPDKDTHVACRVAGGDAELTVYAETGNGE